MKTKRFLSMLLCVALAVSCLAGMTVSASADDTSDVKAYTVKNGDFLYKVCKNNGLDYYTCKSAIMILNGWSTETQCNRIIPGQTIILPVSNAVAATVKTSATTTSSKTESVTINGTTYSSSSTSTISTAANAGDSISYYLVPYTVKSGDYIAKICSDLGTSYTAYKSIINSVNGLSSTKIYAGKVLYIPVSSAPSSGSFYAVMAHRVDKGETMSTICSSYGANASSAMTKGVNDGTNLNYLQAGQVVYVPVTASSVATTSGTSSESSSSSAVSSGYSITFNTPDHGDPYAMVSSSKVTKAAAGSKVTIIANESKNYAQKSILVTRNDSKASVDVENNSFTMPDSDVTVNVVYASAKTITKTAAKNGSYTVVVNGTEYKDTSIPALYGDFVTIQPSAKNGYEVENVTVTKKDGSTVSVKRESDGTFEFTMPNMNVTIEVKFKVATYYTISLDAASKKTATATFKVNGVAAKKAAECTLITANIQPASGYVITKVTVYGSEITGDANGNYLFTMKNQNTELTVTTELNKYYGIAANSNGNGSVSFLVTKTVKGVTTTTESDKARAGDIVTVVPHANTKYDMYSVDVRYAGGASSVNITNLQFTMPAADVTVTGYFKADSSKVQFSIGRQVVGTGSFSTMLLNTTSNQYASSFTALAGQTVKIVPNVPDGYNYSTPVINGGIVILDSKGNNINSKVALKQVTGQESGAYSFTMPADNVTIYCKFVAGNKWVEVLGTSMSAVNEENSSDVRSNIGAAGSVCLTLNGVVQPANALSGSTLVLTVKPNDGYSIKTVTVNGSTAGVTNPSAGVYNYVVKSGDVSTGVQFNVLFSATPYTVLYSDPVNGNYTINGNSANTVMFAGQDVTIKIADTTNMKKFMFDGQDYTEYLAGGEYTFTMPAWDVKTQVTFKEKTKASISVDSFEGAVVTCPSGNHFAGDKIDLTLTVVDVSQIKSITINGEDCTTGKFMSTSTPGVYTYKDYEIPSDGIVEIELEKI